MTPPRREGVDEPVGVSVRRRGGGVRPRQRPGIPAVQRRHHLGGDADDHQADEADRDGVADRPVVGVGEAEPGGRFALDIKGAPVRGRFLELDPPRRLLISKSVPDSATSAEWKALAA